MKKGLTILVLLVVLFCIATVSSDATGDDYVKVGLRFDSQETTAELSSSEGLQLCRAEEESIAKASSVLDGYGDIYMTLTPDGQVALSTHSGKVITTLKGDGTECIVSGGYFRNNAYLCFDSTAYRGGIIPYINASGQLNIINFISLEDYVKGVLDKEMSHNSSLEALKAQAVTARSFAVVNEGLHAAEGFDVCTGDHCQCYTGVTGEYASVANAVDATRGEILYYEGEPVPGYYCANSGGYTENSEDVWATRQGYLRSIRDEYSPAFNWKVTKTASELTSCLRRKGIGSVTSVTIDRTNASASVASITYRGEEGSYTSSKDDVRSLLGVKSNRFTLDTVGGRIEQDGERTTIYLDSPSDKLVIRGSGFGHGIGMSQQGAQEMARKGFSYLDILHYYYTDIEVR